MTVRQRNIMCCVDTLATNKTDCLSVKLILLTETQFFIDIACFDISSYSSSVYRQFSRRVCYCCCSSGSGSSLPHETPERLGNSWLLWLEMNCRIIHSNFRWTQRHAEEEERNDVHVYLFFLLSEAHTVLLLWWWLLSFLQN